MADNMVSQEFVPAEVVEPFAAPPWINRAAEWVRGHTRGLLLAGVFFQLLVLSAMIVLHATPYVVGDRIWLHVRPVDPRDVFRGDYVVLSYDFSRLPPGSIPGAPPPPSWWGGNADDAAWWEDRTVYVGLEPEADGKHWRSTGVSFEKPSTPKFLKGRFTRDNWANQLNFGIEAYFVPEGQGLALEQRRNAGQLSAEIAVAPWGTAKLVEVK